MFNPEHFSIDPVIDEDGIALWAVSMSVTHPEGWSMVCFTTWSGAFHFIRELA